MLVVSRLLAKNDCVLKNSLLWFDQFTTNIYEKLFFRDALPYFYHLPTYEFHSAPFGIDKLKCGGWEEHISQCTFSKTSSCNHHYSHLKCFGKT